MIINHNISALLASNQLNVNNRANEKALRKLSSGSRITRASDDAAGLAISQKMKAQIRGLEQARRNIQDGMSLLQTGESGLSEIEDPNLLRMRELAVQAANGTLSSEDRSMIQEELEGLKSSINAIATNTEFNRIKLLSPPIETTPPSSTSGKSDIAFVVDVSGSMGGTIDNVISNLDGFVDKLKSQGVDYQLGLVSYSDSSIGEPLSKWAFTDDVAAFKNNMETMRSHMLGGGDMNESGLEGIMDPEKGAISLPLRPDASKQFILITDAPVHDTSADGDGGDGLSAYDIDDTAQKLAEDHIKLTVVGPTSGEASVQLKRLSDTTGGSYLNLYGPFSTQLDALAEQIVDDSGSSADDDKMPVLTLQTGANSGETFSIELFDARTAQLGIDHVAVDPIEEAEKSIGMIDHAIEKISTQRAKFGSYQNALAHEASNVENYATNITSAESRISDADVAKEVMELTKSNILQQSAMDMLSQADQLSSNVLNLLKE
ncbi:flagellin [Sporolactobacillus kofuensis]|uniref:Flagellin n=1 Tax=Sporolactobacillus kofuensis TaxID=269672 RepID=A0ABW1WBI5_9BACL|nr:flagellin [Sporolactobacillus kofuensis]MCO7174808.1 flagellin [Sporolactobacillus kofuensis]